MRVASKETKCKMQRKIQDARYKEGYKLQVASFKIQNAKYKVRGGNKKDGFPRARE